MKNRSYGVIVIILALALLVSPGQALAITEKLDLETLTLMADTILIGRVTDQSSHWNADKTLIVTDVVVAVQGTIKGKAPTTITLEIPGGVVGDLGLTVSDAPVFFPEETVILFLREMGEAGSPLVGWQQGKFTIHNGQVLRQGEPAMPLSDFIRQIWFFMDGESPLPADLEDLIGHLSPGSEAENGVTPQAATITSITPNSGPAHNPQLGGSGCAGDSTRVTITGSGFGDSQGSSYVRFWRVGSTYYNACIESWSNTQIVARVPGMVSSGNVVVVVGGAASNSVSFTVTYSYSGGEWPIGNNPYYFINPNCADVAGSGESTAVQAAASTWNSAGANFQFRYGGTTTATDKGYDGQNSILWVNYDTNSIATTYFWWFTSMPNTIIEFDIIFNDLSYTWATDGSASKMDVQNIATHELGHALSLADLYGGADTAKTMYGYSSTGDLAKRSLAAEDIAGIRYIYSSSVVPTVPPSPTSTPTRTPTPTSTHTLTPTRTPTTWTSTPTPTLTQTPTSQRDTLTSTPTSTSVPSHTPTPTPSPTMTPTTVAAATPITVIFQQGLNNYTGTLDATIDLWYPNTNFANDPYLWIGVGSNNLAATVLRYDLSTIPPGATVVSATLHLWGQKRSNTAQPGIDLYQLLRPWEINAVTWRKATATVYWGQAGADSTGVNPDRMAVAAGSGIAASLQSWITIPLTSLVQTWVNNPASNLGAVLKGSGQAAVRYAFASSSATANLRPKLIVNYFPPTPTPTPTITPTDTPTMTSTPTPTPTRGSGRLALDPASATPIVNQIFTLALQATNDGAGMADTVDAYLNFNPAYLEVVDATGAPATSIELNTTLFTSANVNVVNNTAGTINFSATRLAGPLADSFTVATIRLRAKAVVETTPLTFVRSGARWSNLYLAGEPLHTTLINGSVRIRPNPGGSILLTGRVNLERRGPQGDPRWVTPLYRLTSSTVTGGIWLYQPGATTPAGVYSATTTAIGNFSVSLPGLEPGVYDVSVKGANTLSSKRSGVTLPASATINFCTLVVGDSNGDDIVNGADVSYMIPSFLKCTGDPDYRPYADTNNDGCINGADFSALSPNFLKAGPIPCTEATLLATEERTTAADASLSLTIPAQWLQVDDRFTAVITADTGAGHADTVDVYLDFDPAYLQVIAIEWNTERFGHPTISQVDNQAGTINLSATRFDETLTGVFPVATIRFQAKSPTDATRLDWVRSGARRSALYLAGQPLSTQVTGKMITIR